MFFMTPYSVRRKRISSSEYIVMTMKSSVLRSLAFWRRLKPLDANSSGPQVTAE